MTALDDRVTMDRVRDALHRIASVRDLDGNVSVSLPVMYPSGATVVVEIERNDDRYWVSDMGYGFVEAEMSGAQTFYGKIASRIADDFGVGFDGNAMFALWVASARLEAAITCVANASNRACSEAILQATEAKSRRAIEELEARNQWQPIDTAPKDKAVLIYAAGYYVAHFNTTNNRWWTQTDGTGTPCEHILNSWGAPTHWMPLPQPPETDNDRA